MTVFVIVDWLQPFAHEFFIAKGLIGLLSTILLIGHMIQTWDSAEDLGRRMRYYALLFTSFLLTSASYEQVYDDAVVNWRNVGGMFAAILILAAAVISMWQDKFRSSVTDDSPEGVQARFQ